MESSRRQIMGRNGAPVEIAHNVNSEHHAEKRSLGMGGMLKVEELHGPISRDIRELVEKRGALSEERQRLIMAELHKVYPDAPDTEMTCMHAGMDDELKVAEQSAKEIRTDLWDEIQATESHFRHLLKQRYGFAEKIWDTSDVLVGKEGTLIYSLVEPGRVLEELSYVHFQGTGNDDEGAQIAQEEFAQKVEQLRGSLAKADRIADIHQIEVLPEYQGKGIAGTLLDAARWDIEQTQRVPFSVARVEITNHDKEKVLSVFHKGGFDSFYIVPPGFGSQGYYLVVREL